MTPGLLDPDAHLLTLNAGSSSLKWALFRVTRDPAPPALERRLDGEFARLGLAGGDAPDHAACIAPLLERIAAHVDRASIAAVGHRVVHGGPRLTAPVVVDDAATAELRRMQQFDPEHLPAALALIDAIRLALPGRPQVACFDTTFHRDLPRAARLLPIPRRYEAIGVRRYGFHGLSYSFLMDELARIGRPGEARSRVILAHLGNGASLAAVRDGAAVDTTMSLTPVSGMPMSRRSGDLDPGLAAWLARAEGMTADQFATMTHMASGLLGISETSGDMRDLLAREPSDPRAAEAIALFVYQARKWIGAFAASLTGLDTLVFAGGIGENAPVVRERICDGLEFLGIDLDPERNASGAPILSRDGPAVTVRLMRTDEALQMARSMLPLLP